jgi:multidrug resistance efflux pump
MSQLQRIPTPLPLRLRRLRFGVLPLVCFAGCAIAAGYLWQRQMPLPNTVGEAEVVRTEVAAPADGTLVALYRPWTLFDTVVRDQALAQLDDALTERELEATQKDLEVLRKELEAGRAKEVLDDAERQLSNLSESLRITRDVEDRRLDVLDRAVELEVARVELQRREARLGMLSSGAANRMQISDEEILHDTLARRVTEATRALQESTRQREAAEARLSLIPEAATAPIDVLVSPLQAAIEAQEVRVKQLERQVESLVIRAPISGTISGIYCWPGQNVRAGTPLLSVSANSSRYIVSYIRSEQAIQPEIGMAVTVRPRRPRAPALLSSVDRIGPQVELIPERQRRDPRLMEWGLPVRIGLPNELPVVPGELLDVRFQLDTKREPESI